MAQKSVMSLANVDQQGTMNDQVKRSQAPIKKISMRQEKNKHDYL